MYSYTDIRIRKCSISIASVQISAFYNPKGKQANLLFIQGTFTDNLESHLSGLVFI